MSENEKPIPNDCRNPPRFGMFNVKDGTGTIHDLFEIRQECDELREKLRVAREALHKMASRSFCSEALAFSFIQDAREALKKIGEE